MVGVDAFRSTPRSLFSKAVIRTLPLVIGDTAITEDYNQEFTRGHLRGVFAKSVQKNKKKLTKISFRGFEPD